MKEIKEAIRNSDIIVFEVLERFSDFIIKVSDHMCDTEIFSLIDKDADGLIKENDIFLFSSDIFDFLRSSYSSNFNLFFASFIVAI